MTTTMTSRPSTVPTSIAPDCSGQMLTGTLPVRPFHPEGFFGQVSADGQHARVSALACYDGKPILLSLVGHDISISAAFATLWSNQSIAFEPGADVSWSGPTLFSRRNEGYKQCAAALPGTREVHGVALSQFAHIAEGLLHLPPMRPPETVEERAARLAAQRENAATEAKVPAPTQKEAVPQGGPRFVLGNWDEETPHQRSFLANLYAMRVIFLQRAPGHPELVDQWASTLWEQSLSRHLLIPLPALGIKAWALTGTTAIRNGLIHDGLRQGWLPWRAEDDPDRLEYSPAA